MNLKKAKRLANTWILPESRKNLTVITIAVFKLETVSYRFEKRRGSRNQRKDRDYIDHNIGKIGLYI